MAADTDRYEIQDLLGKGTFGQVVKCVCKQTKEAVAIKVIKNKKAFKNQGVVEIKIIDIVRGRMLIDVAEQGDGSEWRKPHRENDGLLRV